MNRAQLNITATDWQPAEGETILAQGVACPFNDVLSGRNDNVLVVGGSGTGKTRGIVRPNLLQATGSYIVSDPKGNLYDRYAPYLRARGYRVERLDFVQPVQSTVEYNFLHYLESETEVLKVAHLLASEKDGGDAADHFWDYSTELLLEAMIGLLWEDRHRAHWNLAGVNELIRKGRRDGQDTCELDRIMREHGKRHPDSLAVKCYESVSLNPTKTWECILSSTLSRYACYDTRELAYMLRRDSLHLETIGETPTAIFVVVSDTDRSVDAMVNVFLAQTMQVLCRIADAREDGRLPVPVRFILDDFATNVQITEFPRMISSIRSRGISAMLMVQSESQLHSRYGREAETIIANCDTYVYLGGNDIETAGQIARRCDATTLEILGMPLQECRIFRRGEAPCQARTFVLEPYEAARMEAVQSELAAIKEPHRLCEQIRYCNETLRREQREAEAFRNNLRPVIVSDGGDDLGVEIDDEDVLERINRKATYSSTSGVIDLTWDAFNALLSDDDDADPGIRDDDN